MPLLKPWLALAMGILGVATPALCQDAPATQLLGSAEIRQSFTGKYIFYSPPGWADAGVHEEFHQDGKWRGIRYSRGPVEFSGRWSVEANKLCVLPDRASPAGKHCRQIWKNKHTGQLLLDHLSGLGGLQTVSIRDLPVRYQ